MKPGILSVFVFAALSVAATAQAKGLDPYYQISSIQMQELDDDGSIQEEAEIGFEASGNDDWFTGTTPEEIVLNQIVNLGKKIWTVVEANRPVVNVRTDVASALPAGVKGWQQLQGWRAPQTKLYRITYTNGFGIDVVDFTYRVMFTAGGNVAGKGRFLTNVTIMPADLSVAWGYTFNAEAAVPNITNAGSMANPIAQAELLLKWKVDTVVKHQQTTVTFAVRGDGTFINTSNGLF